MSTFLSKCRHFVIVIVHLKNVGSKRHNNVTRVDRDDILPGLIITPSLGVSEHINIIIL